MGLIIHHFIYLFLNVMGKKKTEPLELYIRYHFAFDYCNFEHMAYLLVIFCTIISAALFGRIFILDYNMHKNKDFDCSFTIKVICFN